jgi:casein kinase I family protein HRR25
MLIYFLRGKLPWSHVQGPTDDATWELIRAVKTETEPVLTLGLPAEFDALFRYARALEFADAPDYAGLRALFAGLAERSGIVFDGRFDWGASKGAHKSHAGGGGGGHRRACAACAHKREQTA